MRLTPMLFKKFFLTVLDKYVWNGNLSSRWDNIFIREVRIGAMSAVLLYDNLGNQVGLLKFNFTKTKLKENEAQLSLHVLRTFFENVKQLRLQSRHCLFVDVYSCKIFNAERALSVASVA